MTALPGTQAAYRALIQSDRVSARTRAALQGRAAPDDPGYAPTALTGAELGTLRALVARILPQDSGIDLGARLDTALAAGTGDGWRFADLPADLAACRIGLAALDRLAAAEGAAGFAALGDAAQDALLGRIAGGALPDRDAWSGQQLQRWFEDVRAEVVKLYVAHPRTMARIGYSGIAYGGDSERKPGFRALGPGEPEPWEPRPARDGAA